MNDKSELQDCDVSIVVAVFNRENKLSRCVETLVNQNFSGRFEVILVDDQSTDGSWGEMERWHVAYPEKVRIFRNPDKGVAQAKNLGIRESTGRYLMFVDSDDYIPYAALQSLYAATEDGKVELVVSPIYRMANNKCSKIGTLNLANARDDTKLCFLSGNFFFLVGKLFRRDLFERFGLLPTLSISEDVSWVFPVASKVDAIRYVNDGTYYYEFSENSVSLAEETESLAEDANRASRLILENVDPRYREAAVRYVVHRIVNYLLKKFPHYRQMLLKPVEESARVLTHSKFVRRISPELVNQAHMAFGSLHLETGLIPERIFSEADLPLEVEGRVPPSVQRAWDREDTNFVKEWVAVKEVVERGGVFMHSDLERRVDSLPFAQHETVLGYSDDEKIFTSKAFASAPGGRFFRLVLKTYEMEGPDWEQRTLADRIRIVAVGEAEAPLVSQMYVYAALNLRIYPVESFIANPLETKDIPVFSVDRSVDDALNVCRQTFRRRLLLQSRIVERLRSQCNSLSNQMKTAKVKSSGGVVVQSDASLGNRVRLNNALREIVELKNSTSYRVGLFLTWPLRRIYRHFKK